MTTRISSHLTNQHAEEALCEAYIQAVAAHARVAVRVNHKNDYGIDGSFHHIDKIHNRRLESGIALAFQLKASINWSLDKTQEKIIYKLEAKTYNDLARYQGPCTLILLCLPQAADKWVEQCEDYLLLRKSCYFWMKPNNDETKNSSTETIHIERGNFFTPDALLKLLTDINNKRK